ncbi:hypothetical protein [Anaerotruncus colihominis]|uniref:hypothetical protein n=1 Tax=Anaerotruncus colihominis TaxID=169435 RepID=UPI00138EDB26|nr:hypothetical protein [Anaerotruncus colihominis]MCR2026787.1 hypothetical protein [Anaerotruncus colihominis]
MQAQKTRTDLLAIKGCLKNQNTRLFLQTAGDAALKSIEIRKDSCIFPLRSPAACEKFGNSSVFKQALENKTAVRRTAVVLSKKDEHDIIDENTDVLCKRPKEGAFSNGNFQVGCIGQRKEPYH